MQKQLSIVIPAYNEEKRISASIRSIQAFLDISQITAEVIIIVERSTDNTVAVASEAVSGDERFRLIANSEQRGKGYAVRCGVDLAVGEIILFMDADLSTPLDEIPRFLDFLNAADDCAVLIGSRAEIKSNITRKQGLIRRNMGRAFNELVHWITGLRVADTQCGFKAFRRTAGRAIFSLQKLDGFAFDVEILLIANALGYKTCSLPVSWKNADGSKVRIFIDPILMFWDLMTIRRQVHQRLGKRSEMKTE